MNFKVGDRVFFKLGNRTKVLPEGLGLITFVSGDDVYILPDDQTTRKRTGFFVNTTRFYVELESIYNSPLYNALK